MSVLKKLNRKWTNFVCELEWLAIKLFGRW